MILSSEFATQEKGNLYADLSGYYDQFCAEVDYALQCEFAERAFACFAASGGREHLDLACGTGLHIVHMQERGFVSSGLDNSAHMLAQAQVRCPRAHFLLCDIAEFSHVEQFDLITCFLYSIHYSHPTASLVQTMRRAWQALKPGGLFLFNAVDVAGIRNSRRVVTQLSDGEARMSFESGWEYCGEGDVLDLHLRITRESADHIRSWSDRHSMTAITFTQLRTILEDVGFQVTLLEHDYGVLQPLAGKAFNAIVVASKS